MNPEYNRMNFYSKIFISTQLFATLKAKENLSEPGIVFWKAEEMKKRVTIQDIADELGISRNTVSKAINNSDGLADGTREKILQKAIEMG